MAFRGSTCPMMLILLFPACAPRPAELLVIKNIPTDLRFQQVRQTSDVNERRYIETAVREIFPGSPPIEWAQIKTDGDLEVYEGHVRVCAQTLRALDRFYTRLYNVREKPQSGEVIDFSLCDKYARLGFCSNYVKSEIWTTIRGQTLPRACVELWLPDAQHVTVKLDEKGHWQFTLKIVKGRDWVYGVSTTRDGERLIEKYFRVEVHSSRFEPLTKEQFDEKHKAEP